MKTPRRSFLQLMAASAALAATRTAGAQVPAPLTPWAPALSWDALGPRRVLEIYLRGGASLWGSFWYDTTQGAAITGTGDTALGNWHDITGHNNPPPVTPWTSGTLGSAANPLATALVPGFILADHMRVIRVRHDLTPHEAAIPYATTGRRLGRPQMAGLGAAIARRRALDAPAVSGIRSLIFQTGSQSGDRQASGYAASTGFHGAAYQPVVVPLGDPGFYQALPRTTQALTDPLKDYYEARYGNRLIHAGSAVRSLGWAAYTGSLDIMQQHSNTLHTMLTPSYLRLFPGAVVPTYGSGNLTAAAIDTSIDLLTDVNYDLWHACVIDGGVESHYDTHGNAHVFAGVRTPAFIQNGNIWNVCNALALRADDLLDAGIVVLIHSEFGRKETDGSPTGTEHYTDGHACVVISDLIGVPDFVGDAGGADLTVSEFTDASASTSGLTPTDVHAAVAQLAGIEPYQPDMFQYDVDLSRTGIVDASTKSIAAAELLGVA